MWSTAKQALALACLLAGCGRSESSEQDAELVTVRESGVSQPEAIVDASGDCRGPGRYQAGKEGSYRPCCPGLREVFYAATGYEGFSQSPVYDGGRAKVCISPPLRIYACVQGRCGDGVCETGEAEACGCVADCPSALWGDVPTGELGDATSTVEPSPSDAGATPQ